MRGGKALEWRWPEPGRWTATVGDHELCEVEVTEGLIEQWAQLCALDVVHLLPMGVRRYKDGWTGPLGMYSWPNAQRYAWDSVRCAGLALLWEGQGVTGRLRWWDAAFYAREAVEWAASDATQGDEVRVREAGHAAVVSQCAHLHRLIWTHHSETLTVSQRLELARGLRYHNEEGAAAVLSGTFK